MPIQGEGLDALSVWPKAGAEAGLEIDREDRGPGVSILVMGFDSGSGEGEVSFDEGETGPGEETDPGETSRVPVFLLNPLESK